MFAQGARSRSGAKDATQAVNYYKAPLYCHKDGHAYLWMGWMTPVAAIPVRSETMTSSGWKTGKSYGACSQARWLMGQTIRISGAVVM
jgi:hypothetical protein